MHKKQNNAVVKRYPCEEGIIHVWAILIHDNGKNKGMMKPISARNVIGKENK